jgi:hypothetical protein
MEAVVILKLGFGLGKEETTQPPFYNLFSMHNFPMLEKVPALTAIQPSRVPRIPKEKNIFPCGLD